MHANDKNFLIVTASIGAGHNRAAEAIESEIRLKHPNAQIHIADFMSTKTAYLNGFLKEAYLKMLSYVPDMYEFLYSFTSGRLRGFSVQSLLALAMKSDMETLINRWKADVVVCTHPFPCAAAAYLKKKQPGANYSRRRNYRFCNPSFMGLQRSRSLFCRQPPDRRGACEKGN